MTSINTRADLDAMAGTPEHAAFMAALAGTLYRLQKDDVEQCWRAVQDTSTVARFGFALTDFPDALAPALPLYVPPTSLGPTSVTMRQARLAMLGAGMLPSVDAAIAAMTGADGDAARIEWEYAQEVRRDSPLLRDLVTALGLTVAQVDALFETAAGL
jgi:hypothetical protein